MWQKDVAGEPLLTGVSQPDQRIINLGNKGTKKHPSVANHDDEGTEN